MRKEKDKTHISPIFGDASIATYMNTTHSISGKEVDEIMHRWRETLPFEVPEEGSIEEEKIVEEFFSQCERDILINAKKGRIAKPKRIKKRIKKVSKSD